MGLPSFTAPHLNLSKRYVDNVEIQMENKYCPRFPFADGANFGDFTLLFCRGRLRNIYILRRTCWAVFLSIISFVLSCSRCRRRLGLLKVPGVYIYRTRYNFCDIFPPYTWRGLSAGWKGLTFSCKNVKLGNFFNKIRLRKFLFEVEFLGMGNIVWHNVCQRPWNDEISMTLEGSTNMSRHYELTGKTNDLKHYSYCISTTRAS